MVHKKKQKGSQGPRERANILERCSQCHEFVGRNFPECPECRRPVERLIQAAWEALRDALDISAGSQQEQALAETVLAHSEQYWWSEVEAAMRMARCPACAGVLGYGESGCEECVSRSDMLWGRDLEYAEDGSVQRNEHALRVTLRGLSQAHRHSKFSIEGWRLGLPLLLQNKDMDPTAPQAQVKQIQAVGAWIKAGRGHELMNCQSFAEMYEITRLGRK